MSNLQVSPSQALANIVGFPIGQSNASQFNAWIQKLTPSQQQAVAVYLRYQESVANGQSTYTPEQIEQWILQHLGDLAQAQFIVRSLNSVITELQKKNPQANQLQSTTPSTPATDHVDSWVHGEGERCVEIINHNYATADVRFSLLGTHEGVRINEYKIKQERSASRLIRPEELEKLTQTLVVYGGLQKEPTIIAQPGYIALQIPKEVWEPIPIAPYISRSRVKSGADPLTYDLGLDVLGKIVTINMSDRKNAHALVGGMTGGGKNGLLDCIILQTMVRYHPNMAQLFLVDFQQGGINFKKYDRPGIPWLWGGRVVNNATDLLTWCEQLDNELDRRGLKLANAGFEDVEKYNRAYPDNPIYRIVLVVDEFAKVKEECPEFERIATKLTQESAKFGVHCIFATQRPSANAKGVFNPELRGNLNIRLALMAADAANSELILGEGKKMAAQLEGAGDCYMLAKGHHLPIRLQVFDASDQVIQFVGDVSKALQAGKGFPGFPIAFERSSASIGSMLDSFEMNANLNTDFDESLYQQYRSYVQQGVNNHVVISNALGITTEHLQSVIDKYEIQNIDSDDFWS